VNLASFGYPAPTDFQIIWFSSLLNLSVIDEGDFHKLAYVLNEIYTLEVLWKWISLWIHD